MAAVRTINDAPFAADRTIDPVLLLTTAETFNPAACIVCGADQPDYSAVCCSNAVCAVCLTDYALAVPVDATVTVTAKQCNSCTRVLEIAQWIPAPVAVEIGARLVYATAYTETMAEIAKYHAWCQTTAVYTWLVTQPRVMYCAEQDKLVTFITKQWLRAHMFADQAKYLATIPTYTFTPPGYVVRGDSGTQYVQSYAVRELMGRMIDARAFVPGAIDAGDDDGNVRMLGSTYQITNPNVTPACGLAEVGNLMDNSSTEYADIAKYRTLLTAMHRFKYYNINFRPSRMPKTYPWTRAELQRSMRHPRGREVAREEWRLNPGLPWPLAEMVTGDVITPAEYTEVTGQESVPVYLVDTIQEPPVGWAQNAAPVEEAWNPIAAVAARRAPPPFPQLPAHLIPGYAGPPPQARDLFEPVPFNYFDQQGVNAAAAHRDERRRAARQSRDRAETPAEYATTQVTTEWLATLPEATKNDKDVLSRNPTVTVEVALANPEFFDWLKLSAGDAKGITTQDIVDNPSVDWDYVEAVRVREDITAVQLSHLLDALFQYERLSGYRLSSMIVYTPSIVGVLQYIHALPVIGTVDNEYKHQLYMAAYDNANLTYDAALTLPPGIVNFTEYIKYHVVPPAVLAKHFNGDYNAFGEWTEGSENILESLPFDFVNACPDAALKHFTTCRFGAL